jgi:hypothetical protein
MAKVGSFLSNSAHLLDTLANTTYATARRHTLTGLGGKSSVVQRAYFLRTLYVKVDDIAGGATSLSVKLTRDLAGDEAVVGEVTATITTGVTTATDGAITVAIDFAYSYNDISDVTTDTLYLFWKVNAGTAQVRRIELVTEE